MRYIITTLILVTSIIRATAQINPLIENLYNEAKETLQLTCPSCICENPIGGIGVEIHYGMFTHLYDDGPEPITEIRNGEVTTVSEPNSQVVRRYWKINRDYYNHVMDALNQLGKTALDTDRWESHDGINDTVICRMTLSEVKDGNNVKPTEVVEYYHYPKLLYNGTQSRTSKIVSSGSLRYRKVVDTSNIATTRIDPDEFVSAARPMLEAGSTEHFDTVFKREERGDDAGFEAHATIYKIDNPTNEEPMILKLKEFVVNYMKAHSGTEFWFSYFPNMTIEDETGGRYAQESLRFRSVSSLHSFQELRSIRYAYIRTVRTNPYWYIMIGTCKGDINNFFETNWWNNIDNITNANTTHHEGSSNQ